MESSENEGGAGEKKHEKPDKDQPVHIDITAIIKQFEQKTPLENLRILAPELPDDQLAGLFAGLAINLGVPIPDWAISASKQFWKYFVGSDFDPFKSPQHAGVLVGLAEQMMAISPQPEPQQFGTWIKPLLAWFLEESNKDAQKLTPADAAKFHTGRAKSAAVVERMKNPEYLQMIKRAPVYLAVAMRWKTFQSFTSQAEAERWLRAEKIITETVDDREVRAILSLIGLKYRAPGRPRNVKPDAQFPDNPDSRANENPD